MGILDGLMGGGQPQRGGGMSSQMIALLGMLAVAGYQHRDKLGQMLGQATGGATNRDDLQGRGGNFANGLGNGVGTGNSGGLGGLGGGLGGMLGGLLGGGSAGGLLSGGLGEIVDRFSQNGQGEKARSWVDSGPNADVAPNDLESVLGEDSINALQQQTGLSRSELLQRLSTVLPEAVDKMTPHGRIPSEDEVNRWVSPV